MQLWSVCAFAVLCRTSYVRKCVEQACNAESFFQRPTSAFSSGNTTTASSLQTPVVHTGLPPLRFLVYVMGNYYKTTKNGIT